MSGYVDEFENRFFTPYTCEKQRDLIVCRICADIILLQTSHSAPSSALF